MRLYIIDKWNGVTDLIISYSFIIIHCAVMWKIQLVRLIENVDLMYFLLAKLYWDSKYGIPWSSHLVLYNYSLFNFGLSSERMAGNISYSTYFIVCNNMFLYFTGKWNTLQTEGTAKTLSLFMQPQNMYIQTAWTIK